MQNKQNNRLQRYVKTNMKMQQKIQKYIQKHQLLNAHQPIIVGVSGGADSVVLLQVLLSLGYNCVLAHCNFHLRMDESDRDEKFVRELAKEYNIKSYFIDFETTKYASEHRISIEMAARDLRYNWFYQLAESANAQAIAVAHHADDSIETMLMNLVRGTGLKGLTGISARNEKVVRPLLCCTRAEIENYALQHQLAYVTDSSNATLDYQRNKFRNQILPLLEDINPSVRQTLYDSLARFEGTYAIYKQAIDNIEQKIVQHDGTIIKIDIEALKIQADVETVLFELLNKYGFGASTIQQLVQQLDGESGKEFHSETHRLIKDRNYLLITLKETQGYQDYLIDEYTTELFRPIYLNLCKLQKESNFLVSKDKHCIHIDYSKLKFPLTLRRWREGDTFYPFGMTQQKKISDFFIDNKLSILEKEQSWLLVSGNEIVWIVGQRTDNRFRITNQTTDILELRIM